MYGLPPVMDLNFLTGKKLIQVCFGANDLILRFTDDISIAVFSSIGIGKDKGKIARHINFGEAALEILGLLDRVVARVEWTTEGTVTLTAEDETLLQIFDDSEQFESYTITATDGKQIIV